jgi:hypothetical protein
LAQWTCAAGVDAGEPVVDPGRPAAVQGLLSAGDRLGAPFSPALGCREVVADLHGRPRLKGWPAVWGRSGTSTPPTTDGCPDRAPLARCSGPLGVAWRTAAGTVLREDAAMTADMSPPDIKAQRQNAN